MLKLSPWIALLIVCLQGCTMSGAIRHDAVAYEAAINDLTDKFLVENILQARDKAPLHFVDIPLIHESIQTGATLSATTPFAARNASTARASATAGTSIQVSPSFDLAHLNSKDFVTGIASPIDAKFLKYWLDRGLDARIVLLLFVAEADVTDPASGVTIRIKNSPRGSIDEILKDERDALAGHPPDDCGASDFSRYLAIVNKLKPTLTANFYKERTQVGEDFTLDTFKQFKDLTSLDPAKFVIERAPGGLHRLYAVGQSANLSLCFEDSGQRGQALIKGSGVANSTACQGSIVNKPSGPPPSEEPKPSPLSRSESTESRYCPVFTRFLKSPSTFKLALGVRSVGEMIQFLGDLVAYQDRLAAARDLEFGGKLQRHNDPVTIDYCYVGEPCSPNIKGAVLLNLHASADGARFEVVYRDESFWVGPYSALDHSLEVLSVLHQLIDLNKSATDVRPTPVVQVVP